MIPKNSNLAKKGLLFLLGAGFILIPTVRILLFACIPIQIESPSVAIIEVNKGLSPNELTKLLISKQVISNGRYFILLGRLSRQWNKVRAGEYQVSSAMSPLQIFSLLTSGISIAHPVTVREGENLYEIANDLFAKKLIQSPQSFIKLSKNPEFIASFGHFKDQRLQTLEGYFFPDTYNFNRSLTEQEIAKQMVRHFFDFWNQKLEQKAHELGMTRHEIVTLASIIEKETGASEERPLISSVFYNRLEHKMRLQSDPTTIYGIWSRYEGNLQKSDLSEKNEYNTYQIPGLPIGPIANPGKEAITAALYPTQSEFLYFVSHNDGTHEFTKNYKDHLNAVKKFQLDPKAHEGKSWRNLARKQAKQKLSKQNNSSQ